MRAKNLHIIVESSSTEAMDYLKQFGFKTQYLSKIYYFAEKLTSQKLLVKEPAFLFN